MPKRCIWGKCKSDSRFTQLEYMQGVTFITIPDHQVDPDKYKRWIHLCGRADTSTKSTHDFCRVKWRKFICSKHFVGGNGPTELNPDPLPVSYTQEQLLNKMGTETNVGCETDETESCPMSLNSQKRKLENKVRSKGRKKNTYNDEYSDTEQQFTIKIERDDDYEETYVNSYLASEMETVSAKRVKTETDSSLGDRFGTSSISERAHGHGLSPATRAEAVKMVRLEPDSSYAGWPAVTGLPDIGSSAVTEVKTEPCSETEEEPPVYFEAPNKPHTLPESNKMSEPIGTILKREINSHEEDDSEQATTVYVCDLCNECFYSHHQLLKHRENHAERSSFAKVSSVQMSNRDSSKNKPYMCATCGEEFRCDKDLKSHSSKNFFCQEDHALVYPTELGEISSSQQKGKLTDFGHFYCYICEKTFNRLATLKKHECDFSDLNSKCSECSKTFGSEYQLDLHRKVLHSKLKHLCNVCDKPFSTIDDLETHQLIHLELKRKICPVCNKVFARSFSLRQHLLCHFPPKDHFCEICNKRFTKAVRLKKHMVVHLRAKKHECVLCYKSFTTFESLKVHLSIHKKQEMNISNICNKAFDSDTTRTFKKHIAGSYKKSGVFDKKPEEFECIFCYQNFSTFDALKIHFSEHMGQKKKKKYVCDKCDKAFPTALDRGNHRLTRCGERPFVCDTCNKSFTQAIALQQHMLVHKDSICLVCGKVFPSGSDLKQHLVILHSRQTVHVRNQEPHDAKALGRPQLQGQVSRDHGFEVSDPTSSDQSSLKKMLGKPYVCDVCDRAFSVLGRMKVHRMTHMGGKLYTCIECKKSFRQPDALQKHTEVFHSKK